MSVNSVTQRRQLFPEMTIEQIFVDVFSIPRANITDMLQLRDIPSWDSMTHMVLITRIEEMFKVELTGDEIADLRSVADVRAVLDRRGIQK